MANLSDSAITIEQYNSRATYVYRNAAGQNGFHRDQDGVLWAAIVTQQKILSGFSNVGNLDIYKSEDDGFIWTFFISLGVDHYETDGFDSEPLYYGAPIFMFDDKFGNIWVMRGDSDNAIQMDAVSKASATSTNYQYWGDAFSPDWADFNQDFKKGQFTMCGDANSMVHMFLASTATDSLIDIPFDFGFTQPRPKVATALPTINWAGALDCVDASGFVHIAGSDTSKNVRAVRMEKFAISGDFASSVVVDTPATFASDVAIDKDGFNTLCVSFTETNAASTSGDLRYMLSFDDGSTWPTSGSLTKPAGTSFHHDSWEDSLSASASGTAFNSRLIANLDGGFMFSSIFVNTTTSQPQLYVNEFQTTDGSSYVSPSGWVSVASRTDQEITGAEFFRPMNVHQQYFGNKADMRMAYVVGHGNDAYGNDQSKTAVFQERLNTNAYPDPIEQVTITQKNVDFNASGFIGDHTTQYKNLFTSHATSGHLVQHEPVSGANIAGESAFTQTGEFTTDVFFDTISYDRPEIESEATSSQVKAVERDIRKVFFRPDFYLSRTFITNDGGFLKRTVWILEHFGNRYEITQIVPKFINEQICYYEANAFVVGPSNNPFTRTVLPSET